MNILKPTLIILGGITVSFLSYRKGVNDTQNKTIQMIKDYKFKPKYNTYSVKHREYGHMFKSNEILFNTRGEAEDILDKFTSLMNEYGQVSVYDLYELVGLPTIDLDKKYGWDHSKPAMVSSIGHGEYIIDLSTPRPLVI